MNTTPLSRQYNPATYEELGVIKVGDGLFIDNAGELSLGFEVTATAGTGGSITPAGTTHVQAGGEITLYITPDENYVIDTVTINGVQETTPANEYTFDDLSENKTITVTFKEKLWLIKNGIAQKPTEQAYFSNQSSSTYPIGYSESTVDNKLIISCSSMKGSSSNIAFFIMAITESINLSSYSKVVATCGNIINGNSGGIILRLGNSYDSSTHKLVASSEFVSNCENSTKSLSISEITSTKYIYAYTMSYNSNPGSFEIKDLYLV